MKKPAAQLQGVKKRTLGSTSAAVALLVLCTMPMNHAWAKTPRVLVVSSGSSEIYTKAIDTIKARVKSSTALSKENTNVIFNVIYLTKTSTPKQLERKLKDHNLLLTIGQRAMVSATKINNSPPIIATLVPKQSYLRHRAALRKINKNTTAIFIDNPLDRQVLLAKTLLGGVQKLGVLTGENSPHSKSAIKSAIQECGIKSHIETVKEKDNLIRKLSNVLSNSDVFLALPDAQIFNRRTAKNILLTTYRHRTPIIAYSASYVKAGALAAVYSTPQQVAKQTADILIKILLSKSELPGQAFHPNDFEVSINKSVAKSLGISVSSELRIKNEILKTLGGKK